MSKTDQHSFPSYESSAIMEFNPAEYSAYSSPYEYEWRAQPIDLKNFVF